MSRREGGKNENTGVACVGGDADERAGVVDWDVDEVQGFLNSSHDPSVSIRRYSSSALLPTMQPMGWAVYECPWRRASDFEADRNVWKMDSLAAVSASGNRPAVKSLACTDMSGAIGV